MSAWELRKQYPHSKFYFYGVNGYELNKTPFVHDKAQRYEITGDSVHIYYA